MRTDFLVMLFYNILNRTVVQTENDFIACKISFCKINNFYELKSKQTLAHERVTYCLLYLKV